VQLWIVTTDQRQVMGKTIQSTYPWQSKESADILRSCIEAMQADGHRQADLRERSCMLCHKSNPMNMDDIWLHAMHGVNERSIMRRDRGWMGECRRPLAPHFDVHAPTQHATYFGFYVSFAELRVLP
jgi:hypothetical protein